MPGLRPEDRPDVVVRVFKIKIYYLMGDLTKSGLFGRVIAGNNSNSSKSVTSSNNY